MKSKLTDSLPLKIIASIGALLYFAITAMMIFYDGYPFFKPFGLLEGLLIFFTVGFVLAWANKQLAAGIVFMLWNTVVWLSDLYFNRPEMDHSMLSAMASFFMFCGAFFLLEWYKSSKTTVLSKQKQWKVILRVLLINYTILYFIVVFSELSLGDQVNYSSYPFVIYPLLVLIFLLGFILSWKKEVLAGYIFLVWFAILLCVNIVYPDILHLGPWALFGFPILLQGIFYLINHKKFKSKN